MLEPFTTYKMESKNTPEIKYFIGILSKSITIINYNFAQMDLYILCFRCHYIFALV